MKKLPEKIEDIRVEIDRVDRTILSLMSERLELAGAVRRAKSGARVWRPSREDSLIRTLAESGESSAQLVSRIWAELMSASLALQGPMKLHIALEGDALEVWTLVRDRFGAAIPAKTYPTASSALAAAYSEEEGVAILPAPSEFNSWWGSLCKDGAAPDMHILAGLPRVGNDSWPRAVAVATADILPSGADVTLIALKDVTALSQAGFDGIVRAQAGENTLISVNGFVDSESFERLVDIDSNAKIIGVISPPLPEATV